MFLHSFQQSTLYFSRCTVDFISQHKVCKDRAFLYMERLILLGIDLCTDYIGRQQIGSKLNATIIGTNQLRQCFNCKGLSQSRHTFQENVTIGKQAYQKTVNKVLLSYNDLIHASYQIGNEMTLLFNPDIQFADIYSFCHNLYTFTFKL